MSLRVRRALGLSAALAAMWLAWPARVVAGASGQDQAPIPRVERMPNLPQPFQMRDWRQATRDYVALLFDFDRRGDLLPLIRWQSDARRMISLPSYVGSSGGPEAINFIPAVLSGALVGLDMTDFRGQDWVGMCTNYFGPEGICSNGPHGGCSGSFWYDVFPNVLFFQLRALYPGARCLDLPARTAAARWQEACVALGNHSDPPALPDFDHTGFLLRTMTPFDNGRRIEPEGGAGIAWIEYMAWRQFHEPRFLTAADGALRALERKPPEANPLYEVLLPYGALLAARMNAELDRTYDVGKLLDWCFEPRDRPQARPWWGVIADRFGECDCHGLVGSVKDTGGYAFAMNSFQWAGALVPLARYDPRYARAIGKWMLNLANAARLFYPNALPADHQDNRAWADRYDPAYCIAYEGLRKKPPRQDRVVVSPYATGDAMRNGHPSNLCLYGASHVGILGGIVARTQDENILQLDLLKTDYYHAPAWPSFLYYNPHPAPKTVTLDVGPEPRDLYDAVSRRFLKRAVRGETAFDLAAGSAAVIVVAPAGGNITRNGRRSLIDGVIVNWR